MTPPLPREWDTEQRRRYFDALLAYMASPGPATYDELMAAAPGLENDTLAFADGLATQPFGHWVSLLTEMRDALDDPMSLGIDDISYEHLTLLQRQDVYGAWWLYRYFPSDHTYEALLHTAGTRPGGWLADFADALGRFPSSRWSDQVRGPTADDEKAAMAAAAVFGLHAPGRHREIRPYPSRHRVAWSVAVAAAGVALVIGVTAFALGQQSPAPLSAQRNPRLAAWTLAGDIDQPAWQVAASGGAGPAFLSCPSSTTCSANVTGPGSSTVESTTDGGTSWTSQSLPTDIQLTAALACRNTSTCVGAGLAPGGTGAERAVAVVTSDSGSSWTVHALPAGVTKVVALSCLSASACIGAGFSGPPSAGGTTASERAVIVETEDSGSTWSAVTLPSSIYPLAHDLSCTSSRDCVLAGAATASVAGRFEPTTATALYTDDGGAQWHAATLPGGLGAVQALSCAPGGGCLALADREAGATPAHYAVLQSSTTGGRTWHVAPGTGFSFAYVTGVSCPEPNNCIVSGRSAPTAGQKPTGAIATTQNGGASWTAAALPKSLTTTKQERVGTSTFDLLTVSALSCPSVANCVALATTAFVRQTMARVVLRQD